MWSPTKLIFSFYDFSIIYNDFSKIQLIFFEKGKDTIVVTVANRGYCSETAFKTTRGRKMPRFEKLREVKCPIL